ncbi:MAG TPA: RHS repeat-associated core domain-containing protein [Acidimicrobiia bacterium]|nr:RHS repeat-associated core domain-containing protein [Acidimicrobiia bacterium]
MIGGPGGDFISPFSGDVETAISIGPTLKAGGGLELGLTLHHSSKIWVSSDWLEESTALKRRGAFGVGWKMHLGRVYQACDGGNCSGIGKFVYESPDGAQHEFGSQNNAAPEGATPIHYYGTSDGVYIRAEALDPNGVALNEDPNQWGGMPSGWRLYMGNGIVHTLTRTLEGSGDTNHTEPSEDYTDDFRGWYTTKIERWTGSESGGVITTSPVGQITVSYGSGATAHCISAIEFRALPVLTSDPNLLTEQRRITFHNRGYLLDPNSTVVEGGYTYQIDFPALSGSQPATASYSFIYDGPHTLLFNPAADPNFNRTTGTPGKEFLLKEIQLPISGYKHTFEYDLSEGYNSAYDLDPNSPTEITGEMVARTLPTGATIRYKFGTYYYIGDPVTGGIIYLRDVQQKGVYVDDPNSYTADPNTYIGDPNALEHVGFWIFERFRGTNSHPQWSKIRDAFNNETVYETPQLPGQAGIVKYFRGRASQTYGGIADAVLVRTQRTTYAGPVAQHQWTILHDEQDKMVQVQRQQPGPFGQFGEIRGYNLEAVPLGDGILPEYVAPRRKTINTFEPFTSKNDLRWKLWSTSQLKSSVVTDALGTPLRRANTTYAPDGRPLQVTRFLNPANADPNTSGNIRTEYVYDPNSLNLERSFTLRLGDTHAYGSRTEYHLNGVFPHRSYVLDPNNHLAVSSKAFHYESSEVERDPNSGLVTATFDASDRRTDLEYDLLGRPTKVEPPGTEAPTVITYPSIHETVTTRTDGVNTVRARSIVDRLGRVIEARRLTEVAGCESRQTTRYDIAGRAVFVSEPGFDSATCGSLGPERQGEMYAASRGTSSVFFRGNDYWNDASPTDPNAIYDPLGRLLRVKSTDGHFTNSSFSGLGTTVTVEDVALEGGLGDVSTYYERDVFGNLLFVDAPEGADAVYIYNHLDELTRVQLTGADPNSATTQVSQIRTFTYDLLGRPLTTTNPENGTVQYLEYDALGRALELIESDGTRFQNHYDPAGRLLKTVDATDPNSTPLTLVEFEYVNDPNGHPGQGQLSRVKSYDETGAVISDRFLEFGGLNGRPSEDALTFAEWDGVAGIGTLDKTFRTCYDQYDNLGRLTTMRYPASDACGTVPSSVAQLEYTYANDGLVGIEDISRSRSWLDGVTYNPAEGPRKIVHGNGTATAIVPDVMNRPLAIAVRGSSSDPVFDPNNQSPYVNGTLFFTGQYSYDGAGNISAIGPAVPGDPNTTDSFSYDKLFRLASANVHTLDPNSVLNKYALTHNFDDFGNILSAAKAMNGGTPGTTYTPTSQATNRLQSTNNAVAFYDQRGNMLGDAEKQYAFDQRNRLLAAADSLSTVPRGRYSYDAGGERIMKAHPKSGERTFYIRDAGGSVLTELTLPPRKFDEYYQKDYFYALGRVIGMAEEKAPSPVQGVWTSSTYDPGFEEWPASGSATINWLMNPAEESVTAYRVFRKNSPTGSWVQKGLDFSPTTTSFTETSGPGGVAPGATYYYRVAAVNGASLEGVPSRTVMVVVNAAPSLAVPPTPDIQPGSRGMTIRWGLSSDDTAPTQTDSTPTSIIQGYNIYRRAGASGSWVKRNIVPLTEPVFLDLDPNLEMGTEYYYQIRSVSTQGVESQGSIASAALGDYVPPMAPTGVTALPGPGQDEITVVWNPSTEADITGYRVYHTGVSGYQAVGYDVSSYTVTGITDDADHLFAVSALDASSESVLSQDAMAKRRLSTLAPPESWPGYPNHGIGWDNESWVNFGWDHPEDARVRIYRKPEEEPWAAYEPIFTNAGPHNFFEYTDSSFDWCRAYTYQLRAFDPNTGRESPNSTDPDQIEYITERVIAPTTPVATGDPNAGTITITWEGIDHCDTSGNGFEVMKWYIYHTGLAIDEPVEHDPEDRSYTLEVDPNIWAYGFALKAQVRNLYRYALNNSDPFAEFTSIISLDICTNVNGDDLGEHPYCPDYDWSNSSGGGGGGLPPERTQPLLRLIRPGPGATLNLRSDEDDGTRIASARGGSPPSDDASSRSKADEQPIEELMVVTVDSAGSPSGHRVIGSPSPKEFAYSFFHTDHLGSPRVATDPNGMVAYEAKYLPFGEEVVLSGATTSSLKYTGHSRDSETGMDYMMARYYARSSARFLSVDPLPNVNGYWYVSNDPLNYIDPYGMTEFNAYDDGMASMAEMGQCPHCGTLTPGLGGAMASESVWKASCDGVSGTWESEMVGTPGIGLDYEGSDPLGALGETTAVVPDSSQYSAFSNFIRQVGEFSRGVKSNGPRVVRVPYTTHENRSCGVGCEETVLVGRERMELDYEIGKNSASMAFGALPSGKLSHLKLLKLKLDWYHRFPEVLLGMTLRYGHKIRTPAGYTEYVLRGGWGAKEGMFEVGFQNGKVTHQWFEPFIRGKR